MKSIRLLSSLVIFQVACFNATGQSFLTNAQVFDFQPGDVFQTKFESGGLWSSNPPAYQTDTVLSRYDAPGLDSITYVIKRWLLAYSSTPNTPPSVTQALDTLIITDLAGPAPQFIGEYMCPPLIDSLGTIDEACGRSTWFQYPTDTCYFEANGWISWVIAGCGGPYYSYGWDQMFGSHRLVYFQKGTEPCGTFHDLPSAALEVHDQPSILIRLDPSTWQLTASGAPFESAIVSTASGQRVGALRYGRSLDLSAWPVGLYVVQGVDAQGRVFHSTMVKY